MGLWEWREMNVQEEEAKGVLMSPPLMGPRDPPFQEASSCYSEGIIYINHLCKNLSMPSEYPAPGLILGTIFRELHGKELAGWQDRESETLVKMPQNPEILFVCSLGGQRGRAGLTRIWIPRALPREEGMIWPNVQVKDSFPTVTRGMKRAARQGSMAFYPLPQKYDQHEDNALLFLIVDLFPACRMGPGT